jgi:hypothetical protein
VCEVDRSLSSLLASVITFPNPILVGLVRKKMPVWVLADPTRQHDLRERANKAKFVYAVRIVVTAPKLNWRIVSTDRCICALSYIPKRADRRRTNMSNEAVRYNARTKKRRAIA